MSKKKRREIVVYELLFCFCLISFSIPLFGQQTLRGTVVDSESKYPLPGVHVMIVTDSLSQKGSATNRDGEFSIKEVSIGRHRIQISFIGYNSQALNVIVNSGKETVLTIEIEESSEVMEEFKVVANDTKEVSNEMALASAQQFSVEETDRYAGSRSDPARMASNFAGVNGADDSRNDIVVRGNSPLGVVYRVEGVDIPNPNHFSVPGSSGGPVSILNTKLLANSDFFTGAFPAEYGNSTSAVFDLKLRAGNNQKHEFTGQFGFLGTEIMAEGPFSKKHRSSYLIMYRYSTVSLFSALGIDIGTSAVPRYQDLSFKLNFPMRKGGHLSLWGISGKSNIDILISNQKDPSEIDLYGENSKDQYFGTGMAIGGLTYSKPINENTYIKSTLSGSIDEQHSHHDFINRHVGANGQFVIDSIFDFMSYQFLQQKVANSTYLNKKIGKKNVLKTGVNTDFYWVSFQDSVIKNIITPDTFQFRWNSKGNFFLVQPYVSWKHKFSERVAISGGIHAQYQSLGNAFSGIEPRMALKWKISNNGALRLGLGRHSQSQPIYAYYYLLPGNSSPHNTGMTFTKSNHAILEYTQKMGKNVRLKLASYYQSLLDIPVAINPSSFSAVNIGSGFSRFFPDTLKNAGTGHNYGVEFTMQRYFSDTWYAMLSGAIYNSKYKGSDGIERNTDYNGGYAFNLLGGKAFNFNDKNTFSIGGKVTYAGGKRYGEVDTLLSAIQGEVVYEDNNYNEFQFRNYFRADLKITYKRNAKTVTHEIGLDLVNLLGIQNILSLTYAPIPGDPNANPIRENYQLGFLPIFYYRIDF